MGDTEPARAKNYQNVIPLPARRNQWANSTPLMADNFSDEVFQDDVLVGQAPSRMRAMVVSFTPGARTAWHAYPVRQTSIA
jgi:quercetin dioxygenase-like cupin family protein